MPRRTTRIAAASIAALVSSACAMTEGDDLLDPGPGEPTAPAAPSPGAPSDVPADTLVRQPDAIPGEYIVVLASRYRAAPGGAADIAATNTAIDRLVATRPIQVEHRLAHALRGFTAVMTEADALALAADPEVAFVEESTRVWASATTQENAIWGLDRIDQATLPLDSRYRYLAPGTGTTVYVADTGLRATHVEFTGRVVQGYTAINDGRGTTDCNLHGTHVAGTVGGTVTGVAKGTSVVPVRVLGCDGSGTTAGIVAGLDWIGANQRPLSVVNMSLGGPASNALDNAVRNLIAGGVTVVVAAGNENANACQSSPARVAEAITVGATASNDARASFSNFGTCVDIFAPGVDITAAGIASDTATLTISGTSMASPHVAGAVALFLADHPEATPAQVKAALIAGATLDAVTDPRGSPNRMLATRFVDMVAPLTAITSPEPDSTVPTRFTVTADISDPHLASVTLELDGAIVDTRTAPPFTFEVTAAAGPHTLTVTATDKLDNSSSSTVRVTAFDPPGTGGGPQDPDAPGGGAYDNDLVGGCAAGGTPGLLALVALLGLRRRRRC